MQLVLRALLEDPTLERYGLEICELAGLASGTIHPILARLEREQILESRWEDVDPREKGRPRRRYYRLTPDGVEFVRIELARVSLRAKRAASLLRPGLAGEVGP